MEASVSPTKVNADINNVCDYFIQMENAYPTTVKQTSTVTKYTKLPAYDFDARATWHQTNYTLPPRLRRIISFDNQDMKTTRSLKFELGAQQRISSSNYTKRKIITITEADENTLQSKFSHRDIKNSASRSRAVDTDNNQEIERRKAIGRLSSSKYSRNTKPSPKSKDLRINADNINRNNKLTDTKDVNAKKKSCNREPSNIHTQKQTLQNSKDKIYHNENGTPSKTKCTISSNKIVLSKHPLQPVKENETELNLIKNRLVESSKSNVPKKPTNYKLNNQLPHQQLKSKEPVAIKIRNTSKPVQVIHVPLEGKRRKRNVVEKEVTQITLQPLASQLTNDCGTEIELIINSADVSVGTDPQHQQANKTTEMEKRDFESYCNSETQTDILKELDSLYVPNVTLKKGKNEVAKDLVKYCSQSLPNLQVPANSLEQEIGSYDKIICNKSSYIIGCATLTYTTRQKIDFHVVGNKAKPTSNLSSSPLGYPINVVSVFRKKIKNGVLHDVAPLSNKHPENNKSNQQYSDSLNEQRLSSCPNPSDCNKLVKPSDIISTIRVNSSLLQSEQFQRELNFIDSFFESLQYLESCSLSDKYFTDNKLKNWVTKSQFDAKPPEYDNIFSKLENGEEDKNTETMTSKSLCLLNLLIRDEQRRAKNLLFVLKMREDALKDFTKSQIIWLENKKKQDTTDISTLKKKQRGALLKLQHECGEMQRMRKALLALSEKRKEALMKTKKNIEHQLKSDVSIDKIVLGKKKLKRNTSTDRNVAPLKCFDLSSSGCEDSITSRPKSDTVLSITKVSPIIDSVEKCLPMSSSTLETDSIVQSLETAAEHFVAVDGSYLNILFQNMSLPQIFSGGKQYEVNENALKNIVSSTNIRQSDDCDVVEKFMDQIKNYDLDKSSTPSTARSLVEEFDQYYKDLIEEENMLINSPEQISEISPDPIECNKQAESELEQFDNHSYNSMSAAASVNIEAVAYRCIKMSNVNNACVCESGSTSAETRPWAGDGAVTAPTAAGPPPALAADPLLTESTTADPAICLTTKSCPTSSTRDNAVSTTPLATVLSSLKSPVHGEAEELRRQQLAIEREIKALEQQQCQLLVVREIPDKPPPPYTPPNDTRVHKLVRMFTVDESVEPQIYRYISDPSNVTAATEPFDLFLQEFCQETVEKQKEAQSDRPWDASCLLPWAPRTGEEHLVRKATADLKEVLSTATPTVISGVGARRSDHIDDILFAEWRRCEPDWTALHADEAIVKNQLFDSIFQKILTETIDEYKITVFNLSGVN